MDIKLRRWQKYLLFFLFCLVIYFPLFLHLDWQPMNNWDESLFAMRAAYMAEEGGYLRDYSHWVEGGILHRNTKPPFTTWIQAVSMKLMGINELALRLPIALCALATVFILIWFSKNKLRNIYIGYVAGFVLVTSLGFVREHGTRTGDQDAALAFYMLAAALAFYNYIETTSASSQKRRLWLLLFTVSVLASVMTKYVFGLFFMPAFLIYAIYKKQCWNMLRQPIVWVAGCSVVFIAGGWLCYMEGRLPGFIQQAFHHEMADRYTSSALGHEHPFIYYFEKLYRSYFWPWLLLLPLPLVLRPSAVRDFCLLMCLCAISVLLIVSFSEAKLPHYDIVAYPPLAAIAGIGFYELLKILAQCWKYRPYRPIICYAFLFILYGLIIQPYTQTISQVYKPALEDRTMWYGYLLQKIQQTHPDYKQFTIVAPVYSVQVDYYAGLLTRKKNYQIKLTENPENTVPGDTIMVCESAKIKYLMATYELKAIETYRACFLAIIKCKK